MFDRVILKSVLKWFLSLLLLTTVIAAMPKGTQAAESHTGLDVLDVEEVGGGEEGTLIHSILGLVLIQSINANDDLLKSFNITSKVQVECRVSNIFHPRSTSVIVLDVDGEVFRVSPEQKFYESETETWVKSKNLRAGIHTILSSDAKAYKIRSAVEEVYEVSLYELKIDGTKVFLVGQHALLAHNYAMVLPAMGVFLRGVMATSATRNIIAGAIGIGDLLSKAYTEKENSKKNTPEKQAVIDLAKEAKKKGGLSQQEGKTLVEWGKEAGFGNDSRGPESHPSRKFGNKEHIHIGPVNHLPIK